MINNRFRNLCLACVSLACLSGAGAQAQIANVRVAGDVRTQYISTNDTDLGSTGENGNDSQIIASRVRVSGDLSQDWRFLTEGRGVLNFGDGRGEDPVTGENLGPEDFLELRELWVQKDKLAGYLPISARVGRQRFAEPYGFWWNNNFDAARILYDTTLLKGFLAVGENMMSYRTSDDDFNRDDEDVFRFLGETSLQWKYQHFVETRFLYQDDHSGTDPVGALVRSTDRDDNDANLFWGGVRMAGKLPGKAVEDTRSKYRVDLVGLFGEENSQSMVSGTPGFRVVTGNADRDVRAWAFDAAVDVAVPVVMNPVISLGYAFGSGDNDPTDGTNNAFRQTGLDSNFSYRNMSTGGFHNYGTVLRPDLSNLHILTAGIGAPIMDASNLTFIYHYYRLNETASGLQSSGIRAPLNTTSHDVGYGVDGVLNISLDKELDLAMPDKTALDFRTTLGMFEAGDAYGANEGEVAVRGLAELRFRF